MTGYRFAKYSGCGNDFILFDNRLGKFPFPSISLIKNLCSRTFGVGADGIILVENSHTADYRMRIFNSDGSEAEMCGNGIRCLVKFLKDVGIAQDPVCIETMHGVHLANLQEELVTIFIPEVTDKKYNLSLNIENQEIRMHYLNTGVPHVVIFVDDVESINVNHLGAKIRHHPDFAPQGTNVNFSQWDGQKLINRTYERGVEHETQACGTGAVAAALANYELKGLKCPIQVQVRSKEMLYVGANPLQLTGPAKRIFNGELEIDDFN